MPLINRRAPFAAIAFVLVLVAASTALAQQGGREPAAERVPVLIHYNRPPTAADAERVRRRGGAVRYRYHLVPGIAATAPRAALPGLRLAAGVKSIELDGEIRIHDAELDSAWGVTRLGAGNAHALPVTGAGVKVAIMDTGIDYTHPDLAANFAGGYDFFNDDDDPFDDNGHGTHVAGILAAVDDGLGVVGVAPEVEVYSLKVVSRLGIGTFADLIAAVEWAVDNEMDVANYSLGSTTLPVELFKLAFVRAEQAGLVQISSAGNSGDETGTGENVSYPAALPSVIAVAATDKHDQRGWFSSTGPEVEIAAPGVLVWSTFPGGITLPLSGTSMASPHVAGTAALLVAAGIEDLDGNGRINDEVRTALTLTALDLGERGRDPLFGYGLVKADQAVSLIAGPPPFPNVSVTAVNYRTTDGKVDALRVRVGLQGEEGAPVADAIVAVRVENVFDQSVWQVAARTDAAGRAEFDLNPAADGFYITKVTDVVAGELRWDGRTPLNMFVKR